MRKLLEQMDGRDDDVKTLRKQLNHIFPSAQEVDSSNFNGIKLLDGSLDGTKKGTAIATFTELPIHKWADGNGDGEVKEGATAKEIAEAFIEKYGATYDSEATDKVEIDGIGFNLSLGANGSSLVSTQAEDPTSATEAIKDNMNVTFENFVGGAGSAESGEAATIPAPTVTTTSAQIAGTGVTTDDGMTGATFTFAEGATDAQKKALNTALTADGKGLKIAGTTSMGTRTLALDSTALGIKDGFVLKVGDKTYSFAIGEDSVKANSSASVKIEDSKYIKADGSLTDDGLREALPSLPLPLRVTNCSALVWTPTARPSLSLQ